MLKIILWIIFGVLSIFFLLIGWIFFGNDYRVTRDFNVKKNISILLDIGSDEYSIVNKRAIWCIGPCEGSESVDVTLKLFNKNKLWNLCIKNDGRSAKSYELPSGYIDGEFCTHRIELNGQYIGSYTINKNDGVIYANYLQGN